MPKQTYMKKNQKKYKKPIQVQRDTHTNIDTHKIKKKNIENWES